MQDKTIETLSPKEKIVAGYMCRGLSKKAIGILLNCTINTVKTYGKRIYKKLGVNDRVGLVLKFMEKPDSGEGA